MTDSLTVDRPSRPPIPRDTIPTGKRKIALDAMVWQGLTHIEAAQLAGLLTDKFRQDLNLPHLQRYLREQRQVFRESARAQNIHRAIEIRDQRENQTARIQAIRYLDGQADEQRRDVDGRQVTPGVVITVNVQRDSGPADETIIEVGAGATDTQSGGYDPEKR